MATKKFTIFCYGTNVARQQILSRTNDAEFLGYGTITDFVLRFRGFREHAIATLEKQKGSTLPVAVFQLTPEGRFGLDNFEPFPYNYTKIKTTALLDGKRIKGYVYVLKQKLLPGIPSKRYLDALRSAYFEADFDNEIIDQAIEEVEQTTTAQK